MPVIPAIGVVASMALYSAAATAVVGVGTALIGGMSQASAQRQQAAAYEEQARQQQQIANYQADVQRRNSEVGYQLALYQSQQNANLAEYNRVAALTNQANANAMALGARAQYQQGQNNAKTLDDYAEQVRAQGREEARRKREENDLRLSAIRAKYGGSGVQFEGSPLVVLSDAARLAESSVQDISYASELESRKQYRAADMERFKSQFSLIDEYAYKNQAMTAGNQSARYAYDKDLAFYDSEIAGAKQRLSTYDENLIRLGGQSKAYGLSSQAAASRTEASNSMTMGLVKAGGSLISSGFDAYKGYKGIT